jgi:CheY-like chemotaxis protein
MLQRWLVGWGATVASTASASAAVSLAGGGLAFDAAILDDNLNDAPGLARRIAAVGRNGSRLPVVLLATSPAEAGAPVEGVARTLPKPVKMAALAEALDAIWAPPPNAVVSVSVSEGSDGKAAGADAAAPVPAAGNAAAEVVFDVDLLQQVLPEDSLRAGALAARLYRQFFEVDSPARIVVLKQALHRGDCSRAVRELHALVGGMGTLGLGEAGLVGRRLESEVRAGAVRKALLDLPAFESALVRAQQKVREWITARFPEVVS